MTTMTPLLADDGCAAGPDRDVELLAAVTRGDTTALSELYARHAPLLLARLRRRSPDEGLAEEVLQDAFVAAWHGAGRYTGRGPVAAWLWGIALRRLADALRRQPESSTGFDALLHAPPAAPSAEDQFMTAQPGRVGDALKRLDPTLRAAVEATVLDGRTSEEAARLLNLPAGTVRSRTFRARAQLRRDLAGSPS